MNAEYVSKPSDVKTPYAYTNPFWHVTAVSAYRGPVASLRAQQGVRACPTLVSGFAYGFAKLEIIINSGTPMGALLHIDCVR